MSTLQRKLIALYLLLLPSLLLGAQTQESAQEPVQGPVQNLSNTGQAESEQLAIESQLPESQTPELAKPDSQEPEAQTLRFTSDERNVISSIRVSSDYDLLLWVENLGLSVGKDRNSLQNALLKYYSIPPDALQDDPKKLTASKAPSTTQSESAPPEEANPFLNIEVVEDEELGSGTADELIIKTASSAKYFTYEKIEEDVFILQGNVVIMVNQHKEKRQHLITTDKLIYNETTRTGTALGNAQYRVYEYEKEPLEDPSRQESIEEFDSQIISFNIDDFNADILIGNTKTEKEVIYGKTKNIKEKLLFRIYSPHISRSPDKIITVSNASFTSSKAVPPIYRIKLKTMWLLNPEEWAISRASIFVGEIPIMWLPFFVNPGDKFFFHPSIGYKTRTGGFINTTTYLIGEHKTGEGDEEFLNLFNFSKQKTDKKIIKGLYLREIEPGDKVYKFPDNWSLRYLLDYYTGLGGYTALEGKFPKLWKFSTLDVTGGLAFTQTVYNQDTTYFNYYIDEDGKFQRHFDKGYFFNTEIPFRYQFKLKTGLSFGSIYSTSISFEQYSDSFLDRDFSKRAYDFSWDEILDPNKRIEEMNKRSSQLSSYYWQWNNNSTISMSQWVGNYISSLSISNFKFQVNWARKTLATADEIKEYSRGPGTVEHRIESYFFYPSQMEFPSYQAKLGGTLFSLDTTNLDFSNGIKPRKNKQQNNTKNLLVEDTPQAPEAPTYNATDIISPIENTQEEVDVQQYEKETLQFPEFTPSAPIRKNFMWNKFTYKLGYAVNHSLSDIIYYDSAKINTVDDVDYFSEDSIKYAYLTNNVATEMVNNVSALDSWITYKYSITLDLKYRKLHYDTNLTDIEKDSYKKSGDNYTTEDLSNIHSLTVYPLKWLTILETSNFNYTANYDLGTDVFSTVEEAEWYEEDDEDWWNQHKADQTYIMKYVGTTQNVKMGINLPPLNLEYLYSYTFDMRNLSLAVSTKFIEDRETEIFTYAPLTASGTLKFFENKLQFTEKIVYEYEFDYVESLSSQLKLWWFNSSLNSKYGPAYHFNQDTFTFTSPDIYDKKLRFDTWLNSISYTSTPWYIWKDRFNIKFNISTSFNYDFIRFINTSFSMAYGITVGIHKYLNLTFSTSFKNDVIYMYFDEFASQLGVEKRDFWDDVEKGLALGDEETLRESAFKVGSINVGAYQDFGGWVLGFMYKGEPKRVIENNITNYQWKNTIELSVYWKPLPEFKSEVFYREELWSLEEEVENQ